MAPMLEEGLYGAAPDPRRADATIEAAGGQAIAAAADSAMPAVAACAPVAALDLDAIVLAGGLGLRLRSVVSGVPKPMAPIAGVPFLEYLLRKLAFAGVRRATLCIGYLGQKIRAHFGDCFAGLALRYSEEALPLGTGGALQHALEQMDGAGPVLLFNGDTFFDADLRRLYAFHQQHAADITLAAKRMPGGSRYGSLALAGSRVVGFVPHPGGACMRARARPACCINGGIYIIDRGAFLRQPRPRQFSLEADCLAREVESMRIHAMVADDYFLDIGVPEDFARAVLELPLVAAHCRGEGGEA
jgi:D-glycero-alpha-D-manno-heptose 1-phosphate guanylyltransferase